MKAPVEVLRRKKTCKKYFKVVSPTHLPDSECRMGPSVGGVGASLGSLTVIIENFGNHPSQIAHQQKSPNLFKEQLILRKIAHIFFMRVLFLNPVHQVEPPCSASLRSSSSSLAKSEASGLSDSPVPSSALKSTIRLTSATNKKVNFPPPTWFTLAAAHQSFPRY